MKFLESSIAHFMIVGLRETAQVKFCDRKDYINDLNLMYKNNREHFIIFYL